MQVHLFILILDAYTKQVQIDDKFYTLDIIDTAGQEEYETTRDLYLRQGNTFIIVYSITDAVSFEECEKMYSQIIVATDKEIGEVPVILVGNKCDMDNDRQVSTTEGQELAKKWKNCIFIEASAKKNHNVEKSFFDSVRLQTKSLVVEEEKPQVVETNKKDPKDPKPKIKKGGFFSSISENNIDDDLEAVKNSK